MTVCCRRVWSSSLVLERWSRRLVSVPTRWPRQLADFQLRAPQIFTKSTRPRSVDKASDPRRVSTARTISSYQGPAFIGYSSAQGEA